MMNFLNNHNIIGDAEYNALSVFLLKIRRNAYLRIEIKRRLKHPFLFFFWIKSFLFNFISAF